MVNKLRDWKDTHTKTRTFASLLMFSPSTFSPSLSWHSCTVNCACCVANLLKWDRNLETAENMEKKSEGEKPKEKVKENEMRWPGKRALSSILLLALLTFTRCQYNSHLARAPPVEVSNQELKRTRSLVRHHHCLGRFFSSLFRSTFSYTFTPNAVSFSPSFSPSLI